MTGQTQAEPTLVCGGRLLWFDGLTSNDGLQGVITLGWRFKKEIRRDPWSRRFDEFKFGSVDSIVSAAFAVCRLALSEWYWPNQIVGFTAALGSQDFALNPRSRLALLGRRLANDTGREWYGDVLRKDVYRALHSTRQIARYRTRTVRGTHRCIRDLDCDTLIVCDDLVTTGATLTEIARAIHQRNPQVEIIGFALAKTECRDFARSNHRQLANDHLPAEWARLWDDYAHTSIIALDSR